mmetsp:Transcript_1015/g.3182  ORF Transcript_1015/g.3182 Transcript_1015/m.3182 type:complete len:96 (-) Transcript_1015:39-326(-)
MDVQSPVVPSIPMPRGKQQKGNTTSRATAIALPSASSSRLLARKRQGILTQPNVLRRPARARECMEAVSGAFQRSTCDRGLETAEMSLWDEDEVV